jgi:hypothetical protein
MMKKIRTLVIVPILFLVVFVTGAPAATYVAVSKSSGIDEYIVNGSTWTFDHQITPQTANHMVYRDGVIYATDGGSQILKIDADTGTTIATWTKGSGAWTAGNSQGIEFGPDGSLYFSTAFDGNGTGVYRIDTNFTAIASFIPYSGTGFTLYNARDLAWWEPISMYLLAEVTTLRDDRFMNLMGMECLYSRWLQVCRRHSLCSLMTAPTCWWVRAIVEWKCAILT